MTQFAGFVGSSRGLGKASFYPLRFTTFGSAGDSESAPLVNRFLHLFSTWITRYKKKFPTYALFSHPFCSLLFNHLNKPNLIPFPAASWTGPSFTVLLRTFLCLQLSVLGMSCLPFLRHHLHAEKSHSNYSSLKSHRVTPLFCLVLV